MQALKITHLSVIFRVRVCFLRARKVIKGVSAKVRVVLLGLV